MNGQSASGAPPSAARFVVGVDGSDSSKNALRWAAYLATAAGGVIEAVAAWHPFTSYGSIGPGMPLMPAEWDPAADAKRALSETVDEVFGAHRPVGMTLVTQAGHAAKVLLEISAGAGMLVVGSRGHGGFKGLLLGSVSTACAEHATCPVLVVHGDTPPPSTPHATPGSP